MLKVGVIGAGMAGLSAAWTLSSAGAAVTVYDAEPQPGGRVRSDELDGCRVDYAVQLLASTYRTVFRLAEECGAAHRLVQAPGRDALWRGGRAHALQYGSVASLVASTALPASLKLKMGMRYLPFLGSGALRGLDANDPVGTGGAALDDASVAAWGESVLGPDFVQLMAYPLLGAYYGAEPERMSVALYHALARVGTSVSVYAFLDGMGELPRSLLDGLRARGCDARLGERVDRVVPLADGVAVTVDGRVDQHDACVVAVPGPRVAALMPAQAELAAWLEGVRGVPALTLALALDRPLGVDYFGLSFPRDTDVGRRVVAACVQSAKRARLVPAGRELLVVYPAPAQAEALEDATPEAVVDALLPALELVFPRITNRVTRARVYRIPGGYTLFYPGYLRHLASFSPDLLPPRVALAGDYLMAPTVEGAASSGARAAESLLARVPAK